MIPQEESDEEYDRDYWTMLAMTKYGGSFVQKLGDAAMSADPHNLHKIKTTFSSYWKEYEALGRGLKPNVK
jgi:hypothetical protein